MAPKKLSRQDRREIGLTRITAKPKDSKAWRRRARRERTNFPGNIQYGYTLDEFREMDHPDGYSYQIMHVLASPAGSDKDEKKGFGYITERGFANTPEEAITQSDEDIAEFEDSLGEDVMWVGTYILVIPQSGEFIKGAIPEGRYP